MNLKCKECGNPNVVNKFHTLCGGCNNIRLHGSKYGKTSKPIEIKRKSYKPAKKKAKGAVSISARVRVKGRTTKDKIKEDEDFYRKCFDLSDHRCEECDTELPDIFRDDNGKVVARWRYSHIIPKSIAPEIRHSINNINHLCRKHHEEWENGDITKMRIFKGNKERLPNYI